LYWSVSIGVADSSLRQSGLRQSERSDVVLKCILALGVVTGAAVIAPENPADQATICLRHHSPEVCRVW